MVWHPEGLRAGNRDAGDGALRHSSWAAPQEGSAAPKSRKGTAHRARTTAGPPRRNGPRNTARARSWSSPPAHLPGREGQAGPAGKGKVRTHPERWTDPQSRPPRRPAGRTASQAQGRWRGRSTRTGVLRPTAKPGPEAHTALPAPLLNLLPRPYGRSVSANRERPARPTASPARSPAPRPRLVCVLPGSQGPPRPSRTHGNGQSFPRRFSERVLSSPAPPARGTLTGTTLTSVGGPQEAPCSPCLLRVPVVYFHKNRWNDPLENTSSLF